jgi:flagellar biosynthetic protein FliR
MPVELESALRVSTLYGFILVLARVSGIFVFLPLPPLSSGPGPARIVLSLVTTFALFPRWPALQNAPANLGELTGWMLAELAFGLSIGLAVSFILEVFISAAQLISVQAGFSYASTVDPTTNADSTVLVVMAQLVAAVLFFSAGFDRTVITILSGSLDSAPPGSFVLTRPHVEMLLMFGGSIFTTALRLVLPIMTMLLLVDLSLGMIGRLNSQLQLFSLAMPLKMLAALGLLSGTVLMFPRIFGQLSRAAFAVLERALAS